MILKSCRIALEWIVGLVAGLAVLAGLALLWLSREPLQVDFLAPYIESALSSDDGLQVDVGATQLVWAGWGSRIEVAAQDWQVFAEDGRRLVTVPRASVELSLSALVKGQIAPTAITLHDLRIALLRRADGRFAFGSQEAGPGEGGAEGAAAEGPVLEFLFSELGESPRAGDPFAQLSSITIAGASAVLIDRRLDVVWRAPEVELEIQRDRGGVSATGLAELAIGDHRSRVDLTMTKQGGTPGLETVVRMRSFEPASLAEVFPELPELQGISGTLEGTLGLTVRPDGEPRDVALELSGGTIGLDLPQWLEQPLVLENLVLEASGEGLGAPLMVDRLEADLAPAPEATGPHLSAQAVLEPVGDAIRVELMAEVGAVPVADLRLYWPREVGGNGRPWVVENITAGEASRTTLSTTFRLSRGDLSMEAIESFGGRFHYRELEVHYMRPLPPLTGATGSAAFDLAGLDFTVVEGRRGEIEIANGGISIFGLDGTDHRIAIGFDGRGPLREVLTLLDHERLALLDDLAIDAAAADGSFDAKVTFAFPLIDALTFEQVQVGVGGKLSEVALEGSVAGHDLTGGQFDLSLDAKGMEASGTAAVAGIPVEATWSESFEPVRLPTQVVATVPSLSVAQLRTFGLEVTDYAEGLLSMNLEIAADRDGNSRIGIAGNLAEVRAFIPDLGWEKPAGRPGTLEAAITIENGEISRVGDLAIDLGDDLARGELLFGAEGELQRISLDELALGRSSVTGLDIRPFQGDGYAVFLRTGVLDLEPLLSGPPQGQPPEPAEAAASGAPYMPLRLEAPALSRVRLSEGRFLEGMTLELERDRRGWQLIRAEAQVPRSLWRHQKRPVPEDAGLAAKSMSLYYRPEADGSYRFELFADDIGATLRAFDVADSIEGGKGEIVGTLAAPLPDAPLEGRLETKGFRLVEAPAMAKLLTVASLTGIGNLLSGEGIQFDRAVGRFTLHDDLLSTPLFRAYGSSLGITAKGQVDLEGDQTDISGTLVPAYSVNHVLGQIPILGDILTGGEGEGILGVTYRVTGHIDDPNVNVNPLSILAPGFLRGLFGVPAGGDGPSELEDAFPEGHR